MPVCAPSAVANEPETAASRSATSMTVVLPSPRPPYSVGTSTMSRPSSPALRRSWGTRPTYLDSISRTCGEISLSTNSRADSAMARCSSEKPSGVMIGRVPASSHRKAAPWLATISLMRTPVPRRARSGQVEHERFGRLLPFELELRLPAGRGAVPGGEGLAVDEQRVAGDLHPGVAAGGQGHAHLLPGA